MNTIKIFEIKREIEIKREKLNELVIDESDRNLILECSMELDELVNIYNKSLKLDYMKGIVGPRGFYSESKKT